MTRLDRGRDASGRRLTLDSSTVAKLHRVETEVGRDFTILLGSWRGVDRRILGEPCPHAAGGAVDLQLTGRALADPWRVRTLLWEAGLVTVRIQPTHGGPPYLHCLDHGNPGLNAVAYRQIRSWSAQPPDHD